MSRKVLLGGIAALAALVVPPSALAWDGGRIVSVSCPEIHVNLMVENGPWKVLAVDEAGHTLVNVNVPGSQGEQVIGGLWTLDNASHQVTVTIGNAANIADGKVTRVVQLTNCASPLAAGTPGPPGPAGPAGPPGVPGAGTPGPPGLTRVIHEAPKTCTSKRSYAFRVRKSYPTATGHKQRIVSVTAFEPGIDDIKVTKVRGRFLVTWSTVGNTYAQGGVVRTMTVRASLRDGKARHVRLVWKYRPCMGKDGNLNDPSAAGQGTAGGS